MLGPTHRQGGTVAALGGFALALHMDWLIPGVYPILQFLIIYPFAYYGSVWPDLDHGKQSIPYRDPISVLQWKILHLTTPIRKKIESLGGSTKALSFRVLGIFDARHRSWQTHSLETLLVVFFLTVYLTSGNSEDLSANAIFIRLIGIGFALGILAHLFLDAITPKGIWLATGRLLSSFKPFRWVPEKVRFVPKSSFFATGGAWEERVSKCLLFVQWILLGVIVWELFSVEITTWIIEPVLSFFRG